MAQAAGTQQAARKPRMRRIGDGRYLVESTSQPGIGHQVDVVRGRCGCKAGQFGRRCHHLAWSEALDRWYRGQQALLAQQRARATATLAVARPAFTVNPPSTPGAGFAALLECFA